VPSEPVVYVDIVLAINFVMDYMVLWAVSRVGQFRTTSHRLVAAALVGSVYALMQVLPGVAPLFSVGVRIAISIIMVIIAFRPRPARRLLQAVSYFYLMAFMAGGAMLAGMLFFVAQPEDLAVTSGFFYLPVEVEYTWLLVALATVILVGKWGTALLKKNFFRSLLRVPVILRFGDTRLPVEALIDTGNHLKDPITQRPVMIVEYALLKPLLPPAVQQAFTATGEPDLETVIKGLEGSFWAARMLMIPFSSIGRSRGMLLGFRPDELILVIDQKPVRVKDVVVAVYHKTLSPEGRYRALLHPDIIQTAIG